MMTQHAVDYRLVNGIGMISLTGGCDGNCAQEAETILDRLIKKGYRRFILDISGLSFVETPGYRLFIRKVEEVQGLGGNLILVGLAGKIQRVFNLLGLGSIVPTAENVHSAEAMLVEASVS